MDTLVISVDWFAWIAILLVPFMLAIGAVNLYQVIRGVGLEREIEDRLIREQFIKLSAVDLKPSDHIVIHSSKPLPERAMKIIRESMERCFPGRKCSVVESGMSMEVAAK